MCWGPACLITIYFFQENPGRTIHYPLLTFLTNNHKQVLHVVDPQEIDLFISMNSSLSMDTWFPLFDNAILTNMNKGRALISQGNKHPINTVRLGADTYI